MYMCASMRESQKIDIYTLGFQPQITQNSEQNSKKKKHFKCQIFILQE